MNKPHNASRDENPVTNMKKVMKMDVNCFTAEQLARYQRKASNLLDKCLHKHTGASAVSSALVSSHVE
jgi:hypothetical protein